LSSLLLGLLLLLPLHLLLLHMEQQPLPSSQPPTVAQLLPPLPILILLLLLFPLPLLPVLQVLPFLLNVPLLHHRLASSQPLLPQHHLLFASPPQHSLLPFCSAYQTRLLPYQLAASQGKEQVV
jgi:hypothetical protein